MKNKKNPRKVFWWRGVVIYCVAIVGAVFAGALLLQKISINVVQSILFIVLFIVTFYCDDSGIRLCVTQKLPKYFPFYKYLTKKRRAGDRITQYYKTGTYLCLLFSWATSYVSFIFTGMAIILPVLSVVRYFLHNDTIHFGGETKNELSPTVKTILVPGCCFLLLGIADHDYNSIFWVLLTAISLAFIIPFFVFTKEYLRKISVAFGFIFCIAFFVFGSLCVMNMDFDFSKPEKYTVTVVGKYITKGKTKIPHITVTPWNNQNGNVDIHSDKEEYDIAKCGQQATIIQHKGFLQMKWYYLELE